MKFHPPIKKLMYNKKSNKFIYLIFLLILLIISLSFFIYSKYFNTDQPDKNNKEYINSEYGFSIILTSDWKVEEAPIYDDSGTENLFFYSGGSAGSFNIVINELPKKFENIQEYANYLIQKNIDDYNEGRVPYKWEYEKTYFKKWPNVDVYYFEEIKSPAGYEDLIIIISDKYSYKITYSKLNNEGIRIVTEDYRQEVREILQSFKLI